MKNVRSDYQFVSFKLSVKDIINIQYTNIHLENI